MPTLNSLVALNRATTWTTWPLTVADGATGWNKIRRNAGAGREVWRSIANGGVRRVVAGTSLGMVRNQWLGLTWKVSRISFWGPTLTHCKYGAWRGAAICTSDSRWHAIHMPSHAYRKNRAAPPITRINIYIYTVYKYHYIIVFITIIVFIITIIMITFFIVIMYYYYLLLLYTSTLFLIVLTSWATVFTRFICSNPGLRRFCRRKLQNQLSSCKANWPKHNPKHLQMFQCAQSSTNAPHVPSKTGHHGTPDTWAAPIVPRNGGCLLVWFRPRT